MIIDDRLRALLLDLDAGRLELDGLLGQDLTLDRRDVVTLITLAVGGLRHLETIDGKSPADRLQPDAPRLRLVPRGEGASPTDD